MPKLGAGPPAFLTTGLTAAGLGWGGLHLLDDRWSGQPVWWPLAGFGAVMLVFGSRRLWPWLIAGLAVGSALLVVTVAPSLVNLGGLIAGLVENLLIAVLLRRLRPRSALHESPFGAVRVLGCVLAGSAVGSVVFAVVGASGGASLVDLWSQFARNHLLGLLLVSPCLAVSIDREELRAQVRDRKANLEWLAQLTATMAVAGLIFFAHQTVLGASGLVLPLIWGALRIGPLRAMISLLVAGTMATVGTNHGLGRIGGLNDSATELFSLQASIGVLAVTTMVTAVAGRLRERTLALVRQRTGDLNTAERLAGLGSVRWDPAAGQMVWSDGLHLLLGTDPKAVKASVEAYEERLHPDDLEQVRADGARIAQGKSNQADFLSYRIVRPDGEIRDVVIRSMVEPGRGSARKQVFATLHDVTEARAAAAEVTEAHAELSAVLSAVTGTAILGTDRDDGLMSFFNAGAEAIFGYRAEEVIGRLRPMDMHDPADLERMAAEGRDPVQEMVADVERAGAHTRAYSFIRKDGSVFPGQLSLSAKRRPDGSHFGYIGVITDLTSVLRTQEDLAESEKRFRLAFDTSPMGMAIVSLAESDPGRVLRVNDALCDFAGLPAERLLNARVGDFLGGPAQISQAMANLADVMSGRVDEISSERRLFRPDGGERWGRVTASAVRPDGDRDAYLIMLVEDITARKELTERLQHEADHDSLTGLPNRLHLHRRLERELRERRSGQIAVLYLDLDGFKAVNDNQGHGAGDELLIQVADRIAAAVRSTDVVARLGGDEFAVLCPGVPDVATAMRIGRSILASLSREFDLSQTHAKVGASIGVAVAVEGDTGPDLLHAADQAMYAAKRSGKGAVRLNLR